MADFSLVCKSELKDRHRQHDRYYFECPRCGPYSLSGTALAMLSHQLQKDELVWLKISHFFNKMSEKEQWAFVDSALLENIVSNTSLPNLSEQLNNLISWLAKNQPSPGEPVPATINPAHK